ncbi:hypothetical protein ANCDUO_07123 [Ancylostoma duodenale]|uniref:Tc1-like transposase DDE domain-containing protein n=1 Tax=Ancylostoma duodenale TaxID=51022 RepID=A0A0C2DJA8_9BILA|nr:hypothetical protein ANCDUO_07123 [Ancylostoma duodenale]
MVGNNEDFVDCIFTDESTVQRGISMRDATELAVFPGEMRLNSQGYCEILERCFVCFNNGSYHGHGKLVQDNAPAHKSAYNTAKLDSWNVDVVDCSPESPDLNPIELLWGTMKTFLRRRHAQIRNVAQLRDAVFAFWKTLTPNVCAQYIGGIPKRMERN